MGFLETVYTLGKIEAGSYSDPKWSDIDNYLTLPLQESEDQSKSGRIIRVWLEVEDPFEEQLKVKGINKIDLIDFLAGEGSLQEKGGNIFTKIQLGTTLVGLILQFISWGSLINRTARNCKQKLSGKATKNLGF